MVEIVPVKSASLTFHVFHGINLDGLDRLERLDPWDGFGCLDG